MYVRETDFFSSYTVVVVNTIVINQLLCAKSGNYSTLSIRCTSPTVVFARVLLINDHFLLFKLKQLLCTFAFDGVYAQISNLAEYL